MFVCSHATKLRFLCTKSENADVDKNTCFSGDDDIVTKEGDVRSVVGEGVTLIVEGARTYEWLIYCTVYTLPETLTPLIPAV